MATVKEAELLSEITKLALEVNEAGKVDAHVDVWSAGVRIRMAAQPFNSQNTWVYYPDRAAYFSNDIFSEADFEYVAGTYIAELKKHHPQFDADGVKL